MIGAAASTPITVCHHVTYPKAPASASADAPNTALHIRNLSHLTKLAIILFVVYYDAAHVHARAHVRGVSVRHLMSI